MNIIATPQKPNHSI